MKRVLFVTKAREFGGLEVVLLDWLSQVDFSRASVAVCCHGTDALRQKLASIAPQAEIVPFPAPDDATPLTALPQWLRMFSSVRTDRIVFLESMVADFGNIPVLAAWMATRGSVVLFEASWGRAVIAPGAPRKIHYGFLPGIGLYRRVDRLAIRARSLFARHTFVASRGIKDKLLTNYGYPAVRTSILYHGVNTSRFRASAIDRDRFRRENSIPEDATVIVAHGRLVRTKRVDRLVEAFERLFSERPRLWLVLTSYGPLKSEVERLVAKSPASPRIRLVGFQENPAGLLSGGDIYCISSDDEGFGIALVEALSAGLICVATSGSGPKEILAGGEFGFLVEPTVEGVRNGLQEVLKLTPEERARIVDRGRRMVESRFEINSAIRAALDALEIPRKESDE